MAVLGRLTDAVGKPLNTERYALPTAVPSQPPLVIAVLGTGMKAGKTSAASGLINGFARLGRSVAAIKVTGTGSFGDVQEHEAAGASQVLDFTDAGIASTHSQPINRLIAETNLLLSCPAQSNLAVVELADNVSQAETAALLAHKDYRARFNDVILAAPDAMAARGGLAWLAEHRINALALSGLLTRAPLAIQEISEASALPVLCRNTLADPATASAIEAMLLDKDRAVA